MDNENIDCEQCRYGADGRWQTITCCYLGAEECDPFGQCEQFEEKEIEDV